MNSLEGFLYGLEIAIAPELLVAAFLGAFAGTLVGVLPGIGPVAGAAVVLPITFMYDPLVGMVLISAIYLGSQFGGSITSVLVNIPGDAQSIVATFDGYPLAQKGRAGAAIGIMVCGSFIAGVLGILVVLLTIPIVTPIALSFGPAEFFALTAGGLIVLSRVSGGSIASGLFPMAIGVALATVGTDAIHSYNRYTFGMIDLAIGISLAMLAVGLYGISEILYMIEDKEGATRIRSRIRIRDLRPNGVEVKSAAMPWVRGSLVGYGFGILPGPSATLATFGSYRIEQAVAKDTSEFGKGKVAGLAGPEAANSGATVGSMVPALLLGLPFSATLAMMLAAMQVHGIAPGPLLIDRNPELFWSVIAALFVCNIMLVIINVPLVGVWIRVVRTPVYLLAPAILLLGAIGVYSVNTNLIDLRLMVLVGVIGYILRKANFSIASMLIGLVLGSLVEQYFLEGMAMGAGDPRYFLSTPLAAVLWSVVILTISAPLLSQAVARLRRGRSEQSSAHHPEHRA
ncbi:tripartite tricarboxylate transporter permease [Nesterenkonia muleiensis]|uniref:tripartite tricarboxylate transporter permease n=1 Tax=Nesterenkonia muleiensis TaxID=2282648 RepID=UPI000E735FA2|nr:tripartite tricarboxylate transporter permease [Nesterenkonia muleiensis]